MADLGGMVSYLREYFVDEVEQEEKNIVKSLPHLIYQ